MGASSFIGRVGGLAVALGVGVATFAGNGVAFADRGDGGGSAGSETDSSSSSNVRGHRGPSSTHANVDVAAPRAAAATITRGNPATADSVPVVITEVQPKSGPIPAAVIESVAPVPPALASVAEPAASEPEAIVTVVDPQSNNTPVEKTVTITTDPVVNEPNPATVDLPVAPIEMPEILVDPAPEPAVAGDLDAVAYATGSDGADGAGSGPSGPADSALVDAVLASFIRRENTLGVAATSAPSALVTTSAPSAIAIGPITLNPELTFFDGVIQGNLNPSAKSGCGSIGNDCTLSYSLAKTSDGGKATFDTTAIGVTTFAVPADLPGGGPGGFTFLPYATWIDPANPTKNPTATGTQTFTVRVAENTKFDQTITNIPLIGQLALAPIIELMQDTPFIGDLLAPLIGNAVKQEITVDVAALAAGKQVAYTYKVASFDGTLISMNFFPASEDTSLLPELNNEQATIFNGPGFGGAGQINPYTVQQAAGSVPGISLMRGQGPTFYYGNTPLPFGFNVITWDPRGEWDSGGILQADNPFYEGRDVSSLIDWAQANTPLLNEDGQPDVAMMGGSYGGGIQMTTVDPRIKAIVPSIAWNSLNESLYPDQVFKSAWAIDLGLALLLSGASSLDRVNSLITQSLITGVLFGSVSESAQALFASTGPTTLLTKLNAPSMYDQGIIDGLFPLQQALNNAQTQLEQNPFFAGDNADLVKMIWFCGGHGVCTTQSLDQQTDQATVMFAENLFWLNKYTKGYIKGIPNIVLNTVLGKVAPFQWWDQNGKALESEYMPWAPEFQDTTPISVAKIEGGRINSFTSVSGPLTEKDAAGGVCESLSLACQFPLNQVTATKAKNAVDVNIPVTPSAGYIVGAPKVSFTYSGIGNAKAVYAQIVDNATGQVLGNINTPIPVTLDGKTHTVEDFEIANIAYTAPSTASSLTLQIVANTSMFQNNAVIWSVDINKLSVSLPTTSTAKDNAAAKQILG